MYFAKMYGKEIMKMLEKVGGEGLKEKINAIPLWIYLGAGTVVSCSLYIKYKWSYWERRNISGPPPSIYTIGHTAKIFGILANDKIAVDWIDEYGKIFGIYCGLEPAIFINDVDMLKEINVRQFSKFSSRKSPFVNTVVGPLSKDFMTNLDGHKWKRVRQTTMPTFSALKLESMCPSFNNSAKITISEMLQDGTRLNVRKLTEKYSMRAVLSSAFSLDASNPKEMEEAGKHGLAILGGETPLWKLICLSLVPERVRFFFNMTIYPSKTDKWLRNLFQMLLNDSEKRKMTGNERVDFTSQMFNSIIPDKDEFNKLVTKGVTKNEILSNSLITIVAGYDNVASSVQVILFRLATNPKVQSRLFQDILALDEISYESIKKLKYLDAIIKESMRLNSPATINSRYCTETTEVNGLIIEKGTTVFWHNPYFHRNSNFYNEPEKFNPDRFEGSETNTLQDDYWFGFGQGPRACPGVRWSFVCMKIFIAQLMKKYKIEPCDDTPDDVQLF